MMLSSMVWASDNQVCLDCHEGDDADVFLLPFERPAAAAMNKEKTDDEEAPEIILSKFTESVHGEKQCTDCHKDATEDHEENDEPLKKVDCAECHKKELVKFNESVHGEASLKRKDRFAPTCYSCHGNHYTLPSTSPRSSTYVMNIPATCGNCHKEGTPMTESHEFEQSNVFENYSMSLHGTGLFKRGLTITAVCTNCHGTHDIMNHKDPRSKIGKKNIVATCLQCHGQIEKVHDKIIKGQLWEHEPGKIPVCVECHSPHKVRNVVYEDPITDKTCLSCHSDPNLQMTRNGRTISLYTDESQLKKSVHFEQSCVKCHFDVNPARDPVCKESKSVDCSVCHAEPVKNYSEGIHGKLLADKDKDAPYCTDCHGTHGVLSKHNPNSPTFPEKVPELCGGCHKMGQKAANRNHSTETDILGNYTASIHGKGLFESGLLVTATCQSCHTSHKELPADDPQSTVNPKNVAATCANCHYRINERLKDSVHSPDVTKTDAQLPTCNDCHSSHTIKRTNLDDFRLGIMNECGQCHEALTKSYLESYHGKVSKLGVGRAAKCNDCHGSHNMYPKTDPRSTLHSDHIVETCQKCHPHANENFASYLPHATHDDKEKHPELYYSYWFMTILLGGTMIFFGLHTLLWGIRSVIHGAKHRRRKEDHDPKMKGKFVRRFKPIQIVLHLLIIISFLSLAVTGMTLKFYDIPFFASISHMLGGPITTGIIHRIGAFITLIYAAIHLYMIIRGFIRREFTVKGLLKEEYTMVPLMRDLREMKANILWFIGLGKKPEFGHWTYWEKFDYLAVFWGIAVIGSTGLVLWFPEVATILLPGWMINVATIIHSDEALLASAFIFTIHFFNSHFRPGKFPMDPVIFTGVVPLEEFIEERPREYQQMVEKGELDKNITGSLPKWYLNMAHVAGLTFLTIGIVTVIAIIYSLLQ
ncbi:MAG: cytochrome c3 family protein [SAR324 cluster bacterium]|nr:cytochrome c3 family protein [SAR324 cluster bacterium]